MQIYLLIACDRLDDKQEAALKDNLPDIQAALQAYADANPNNKVELINDCDSDDCEAWQLGITQTMKKSNYLKFPVNLFNDLAKAFGIDCEIGAVENGKREPVSYFGKEEGKGDTFMIAQYLGL